LVIGVITVNADPWAILWIELALIAFPSIASTGLHRGHTGVIAANICSDLS
jgi:hypothetical protein